MKKLIALLVLLFAAGAAFAQSAAKITEILGTEKLTWGQAAYLCASATGEPESEQAAFSALRSSGAIGQDAGERISLRDFAHLCAGTWDVKGSLFLMLFGSPRYALRQMKADGIISEGADGSRSVSGREAMNIISECLDTYALKAGAGRSE